MAIQSVGENTSFQEIMVDALQANFSVTDKAVLEVASDPWLLAARRLLKHGARHVIASDSFDGWCRETDPRVEVAIIDACRCDEVLANGSIDVVIGINFLEHLLDIPKALRSIWRTMRRGGFCFLHGHPIWTSARGHHAMLGYMGATFSFSGESNPIPLWGHLYMGETELRREMAVAGHPDHAVEAAINWVFHCKEISRLPRRRIVEQVEASPLRIEALWQDRLEAPDITDLVRIRYGAWWDPEEDYGVRGMTFLLRKD